MTPVTVDMAVDAQHAHLMRARDYEDSCYRWPELDDYWLRQAHRDAFLAALWLVYRMAYYDDHNVVWYDCRGEQ